MGTVMRILIALLLCASAFGQYYPPNSGGGGSGTVTSVGLAGTANQITVTGTSPVTGSGSWTLSFPVGGVTLPGTTTGTFSGNLTGNVTGNTSGSAGSVLASGVTAGAFAAGAYTIPTGGSLAPSGSGTIDATSLGGTAAASYALLNSPSFTTPTLGVATATSINKVAFTAPATSATLTLINGTTFTGPAVSGTAAILGANTFVGQQIVSLNGAASTPPVTLTGTWFSGGSATTTKPQVLIEPTGVTSNAWSANGTGFGINAANGVTGNLADFQTNGTSRFRVSASGQVFVENLLVNTNIVLPSGGVLEYTGRSKLGSDANGDFTLYNNAFTSFNKLNFGGITSSFPALKRSGTEIQVRLADDSAYGTFEGKYNSSDGSAGVTVTSCTSFKDGLCVAGT
jgi:hypothetical protein